jgi:hypothetical protein
MVIYTKKVGLAPFQNLMQQYSMIGGLVFILCVLGIPNPLFATNTEESHQAEIQFDHLSHDFGTLLSQTVHTCTFDFTNTGDAPLIIYHVQVTCGCTVPDYTQTPIQPGECGRIQVTYRAGRGSGNHVKYLLVYSNATDAPQVQLEIQACVETIVECEPLRIHFLDWQPGETSKQKELHIKLNPSYATRFQVINFEPTTPLVHVELIEDTPTYKVLLIQLNRTELENQISSTATQTNPLFIARLVIQLQLVLNPTSSSLGVNSKQEHTIYIRSRMPSLP